jgi:hypothetical protein
MIPPCVSWELHSALHCRVKGFGSKGSEPSSSSSPTAAAGKSEAAEASTSSSNVSPTQSPGIAESDKRWRLKAYDVVEWKEWLDKQREFASLPADARDLYVQVGGRRSGDQCHPIHVHSRRPSHHSPAAVHCWRWQRSCLWQIHDLQFISKE